MNSRIASETSGRHRVRRGLRSIVSGAGASRPVAKNQRVCALPSIVNGIVNGKTALQKSESRHQRAFTLIEVLVAVTIGSMLMMSAVTLIHTTMQVSQASKQRVESQRLHSRFMQQFRRDIWLAEHVELVVNAERDTSVLMIELADSQDIQYSIGTHQDAPQIIRQTQAGGREVLELPANYVASFSLEHEGTLVALQLASATTASPEESPRYAYAMDRRAEAVVGKLRMTQPANATAQSDAADSSEASEPADSAKSPSDAEPKS